MISILVGNFGLRNSAQNGQTQKTLQIWNLLRKTWGGAVRQVDTSNLPAVARMFTGTLALGRGAGICVGPKGLRFLAGLYALLKPFGLARGPIFLFAVGGWLPSLASSSSAVYRLCRGSVVLVETQGLVQELRNVNIQAGLFPNFRDLPLAQGPEHAYDSGAIRLVFCGRILAAKGFKEALTLCASLRRSGCMATLDFYGPVDDASFATLIERKEGVRYCGSFDDVAETAQIFPRYDFLVLPSFYPGECVPGAVVEAMFAGVPSIVSNWRFLPEIVRDGALGFVCSLDEFAEDAQTRLATLTSHQYDMMRSLCLQEAESVYTIRVAKMQLELLAVNGQEDPYYRS
jgi:glycosyltransferase involved in cell wall biosynthesis